MFCYKAVQNSDLRILGVTSKTVFFYFIFIPISIYKTKCFSARDCILITSNYETFPKSQVRSSVQQLSNNVLWLE